MNDNKGILCVFLSSSLMYGILAADESGRWS